MKTKTRKLLNYSGNVLVGITFVFFAATLAFLIINPGTEINSALKIDVLRPVWFILAGLISLIAGLTLKTASFK